MFSQDDGRLFFRLGVMLSMHITKTVKSRTKRNYCNQVTNGKHIYKSPFQKISKQDKSM